MNKLKDRHLHFVLFNFITTYQNYHLFYPIMKLFTQLNNSNFLP